MREYWGANLERDSTAGRVWGEVYLVWGVHRGSRPTPEAGSGTGTRDNRQTQTRRQPASFDMLDVEDQHICFRNPIQT